MIKDIARHLLPKKAYSIGRQCFRRVCRQVDNPPLDEQVFAEILVDHLRLATGDIAMVHSSMDRLQLGFSFTRVLPALRGAVGSEGTLLLPATHLTERPETWLERGEVFDVRRSPTSMGLLPELARRQRDAVRSLHPTHSVVALGPRAQDLVGEHHLDIYPCGRLSPYYKIAECEGSIIGLGVDVDVLTSVHCVEDIWRERFPVTTHRKRVYAATVCDGESRSWQVQTLAAHPRIRWRQMLAYMHEHVGADLCQRFFIAGRPFYRVEAAALYARMEELAERGITMYRRGVYRGHPLEPLLSRLAEKLEER
ncbi:MAG: aminoglycoside 3-N-acetyltransferase [Candidatus Latescibacterota bacterium]|jgi:aminoglycoside 3-N-acetyltransferase